MPPTTTALDGRRRVVGCSAGALAGGLWSSGLSGDELARELLSLRREEFWDPGLPLGGLLKGRKFNRKLQQVLARSGARHLHECRVPFTAIVHDVVRRRTVAMDQGRLDLAIQASCTVPLMFRPVWVEGRLLVDGGVSDRVGMSAVEPDERVLMHYLPSRRRLLRPSRQAPPAEIPGQRLMVITPDLPRVTPFRLDQGRSPGLDRGFPLLDLRPRGLDDFHRFQDPGLELRDLLVLRRDLLTAGDAGQAGRLDRAVGGLENDKYAAHRTLASFVSFWNSSSTEPTR